MPPAAKLTTTFFWAAVGAFVAVGVIDVWMFGYAADVSPAIALFTELVMGVLFAFMGTVIVGITAALLRRRLFLEGRALPLAVGWGVAYAVLWRFLARLTAGWGADSVAAATVAWVYLLGFPLLLYWAIWRWSASHKPYQAHNPRGGVRCKYLFLVCLVLFAAVMFWTRNEEPLSYVYLGFFCAIALALSLAVCWEIWVLRTRLSPRWLSNLTVACSGVAILVLLQLHEQKIFVWNHLYVEIPFALFWTVTTIGAWLTEWRQSVRVYAVRGGFAFVPVKP